MSSINQNTIRTPRVRLRSATQRQNTPSALARRTQALETRRTNLGNTILELEADLRQQRGALGAKIIEVDQARMRRDDEHARYERLRDDFYNLRNTLSRNFIQTELGIEYRELMQKRFQYTHNRDENTDINDINNVNARFDYVNAQRKEILERGLASISAEKEIAEEAYRLASERHDSLYQQQRDIVEIILNLDRRLTRARIRDRLYNQARGKRQRKSKKKGKKGKNTRKRRP